MRPLDRLDRDAPVSALVDPQGFWDHLGSTRAEEYAREDILPISVVPVMPAPQPERVGTGAEVFTRDDLLLGSLDDTLQAVDALDSPSRPAAVDPNAPASDSPEQDAVKNLPPDAGFVATIAPMPRTSGRLSARKSGIADSRLGYRLQRIWLTPLYRAILKFGVPTAAVVMSILVYFSNENNRETVTAAYDTVYSAFVDRPEFLVTSVQWPQVAPELDAALKARLHLDLPLSSFRLDLDALRVTVEALDWVRSAELRLLSDGVLAVNLIERVPAMLWRSDTGLELLDDEGVRVALVANRNVRADLPLIAGVGAPDHMREALDLFEAAAPLGARVQGLVRVGERRWDVVLDRDQRIRLPERDALAALERVMALEQAQDLLARDLLVADLRNPSRPVLQISASAMDTLREIRSSALEAR